MRSLALCEIAGQGSDSKSSLPCRIWRKIPISVSGGKEIMPQKKKKKLVIPLESSRVKKERRK